MKRVIDNLAVTAKWCRPGQETEAAECTLDGEMLRVKWQDPSGAWVATMMPRDIAMQVVKAIASAGESAADSIIYNANNCGYRGLTAFVYDQARLTEPINIAFACPADSKEWVDIEDILCADIGGGYASIMQTSCQPGGA